MQSKLNLQIKKRESFRPFAPIVLAEYAHTWFDWPQNVHSKYMLFTAEVNSKAKLNIEVNQNNLSGREEVDLTEIVKMTRSQIPAVTHVDMSARLQTITPENPVHGVLSKYFSLSGVPVLVNTSFNVRNEPIVESPIDAIRCFMTTEIDVLAIGGFLVLKENQNLDTLLYWEEKRFVGELD